VLGMTSRRLNRCRNCGSDSGVSDLCGSCRRAAADAAREQAAVRLQRERARDEEERRNREREADLRNRVAREAEEARRRQEELARRIEAEQAQKRRHVEQPDRVATAATTVPDAADNGAFDPYKVLGVPREVCKELISIAYHQAKKRLDPTLVEHLGDEAQAHFRAKAEALDRAYEMLVLFR